eukprot:gb/GECG01000141.1/.p1 GENE.gb/GECG01000141.1/~~gb/GECG01000141.1/.p1  ORF type:complete len:101 (+),score=7.46 gb/GECG01000141.1/:1-303(+)
MRKSSWSATPRSGRVWRRAVLSTAQYSQSQMSTEVRIFLLSTEPLIPHLPILSSKYPVWLRTPKTGESQQMPTIPDLMFAGLNYAEASINLAQGIEFEQR